MGAIGGQSIPRPHAALLFRCFSAAINAASSSSSEKTFGLNVGSGPANKAIFGNKRVLRPGEDDEKLEQILKLIANDDSDVEMSDDENEIENMDNLVQREDEINDEDLVSSSDEEGEDRIPLSVLREKLRTAKQTPNSSQRQFWRRNDTFTPPNFEGPSSECSAQLRDCWTAKSYFAMYLEDDMFQKVCDCTNARYVELKGVSLRWTLNEIKHFFGIICLMSCLKYPRIRMYWAKPTRVAAIADVMTRDRFFSIRSNLKVVIDGSISEEKRRYDKFWKVRPILEAVLQGCLQLPREKVVAVDEQMIPFTGTCQMKQFVRGKPNPEGLKNFVVAAPDGLVVDFELYQGKNTFPDDSVKRLGVGPSAVVRLGRTLFPGTHVYCDRYFTTIPLLEYLRQQKKYCTGTIMKSRVPAAAHLTSDKMMAKIGRGSSEQIVRQDGEIVVVQWYDLKSVLLASTRLGIQPSDECKRWSKKDSKYIQVARPYIVAKYNDCMGGIDLIDRMISCYRIQARSKKWTVRVIFHFFDLALANSWIFYRRDKKIFQTSTRKIQQYLDFKIEIATYLLKNESNIFQENIRGIGTRRNPEGNIIVDSPSAGTERKRKEHYPEIASDLRNSVRCKNDSCTKKTKFFCNRCNTFLCITGYRNCFIEFHNR
ncbi:unnamed protein product [Acanthoscelides obtectus]|uniref:PiggyBac transposable element-derived protein domain-containing protein n=1 Tax=Acanthoscelides obtectus TaxID=200917 RepID=A0A9P0Q1C9_ACAOB|nr:unnamed protein product [Acanthoscelides obtectus]CAK1676952.1 PiggyBac transposable element-derived protein 3 [Acanthoscelides obtectus]